MSAALARLAELAAVPEGEEIAADAAVAAAEELAAAHAAGAPAELKLFTAVLRVGARLGARDQARFYRTALPLTADQPRYAKLLTDRIVAAEAGAHEDEHDAALEARLAGADAAALWALLGEDATKEDPARRRLVTERLLALERTAKALLAHAAALKAAGQPRAARAALEEALTHEQTPSALRRTRSALVAVLRAAGGQEELRAARAVARQMEEDAPEDLTVLRLLAALAVELADLPEAERLLVRADELDPGNSTTLRELQTLSSRVEEAGDRRAHTRIEGLLQRRSAAALDRRSTT